MVTNDSSLRVGVQESAKSLVVPTVSENVESYSAFSLVIWLLHVFLFEEVRHVFLPDPKDVLVGQLWLLGVLIERRSTYVEVV